jgi:hypothetical protein
MGDWIDDKCVCQYHKSKSSKCRGICFDASFDIPVYCNVDQQRRVKTGGNSPTHLA